MNEYIHDSEDSDVLGLIVECTGGEKNSTVTKQTLATFNMLRKHADFEGEDNENDVESTVNNIQPSIEKALIDVQSNPQRSHSQSRGINLSYTINLNLPATKDIEVFNAIFKSLKQHLLDQ
ncbi:hypothetical protein D3C75_850510 [compost metagenome]